MKDLAKVLSAATLAASVILGGMTSAYAKDLCIGDPGTLIRFSKVKLPKTAGSATTLQGSGVFISGAVNVITGAAVRLTDGTIQLGLMSHGKGGAGLNDYTLGGIVDDTLAGTLNYDNAGDYNKDSGTLVFTVIDCSTIVFP